MFTFLWPYFRAYISLTEREKLLRNEFCGSDTNSDQYELFRYTAVEDLEAVFRHRNRPDLTRIIDDISSDRAGWNNFLKTYRQQPEEAHFILLAAYRYGKGSKGNQLRVQSVATAFYFLSAAIEDPAFIMLIPGVEIYLPTEAEREIYIPKDAMSSLPECEQITISVHKKQLNNTALELMEGTIFRSPNALVYGITNHEGDANLGPNVAAISQLCNISSVSILEKILEIALFRSIGGKLTYNFGFPNRREYIDAMFNGQYSYALLSPYSKSPHKVKFVHGAPIKKSSLWLSRHDISHIISKFIQKQRYGDKFATDYQRAILKLQSIYESRPPIQATIIEEDYAVAHLSREATVEDFTTRLIDELLIRYLDGPKYIPSIPIPNIDTFSEELAAHLQETMSLIIKSKSDDKYPHQVFDNRNTEMQNKAIKNALAIIEPELKMIIFPPSLNGSLTSLEFNIGEHAKLRK